MKFISVFVILFSITNLNLFGQQKNKIDTVNLSGSLNANRIELGNYILAMYNQNKDTISNCIILNRQISKENYGSIPCIKIIETNKNVNSNNVTTIYIDSKTLKPVAYESNSADTNIVKAVFENGKMILSTAKNGNETKTESDVFPSAFLSNSFSELVQSNDFNKNSVVKFQTFTPGYPRNQFIVERIGEKKFSTLGIANIDCWLLKFTRIDSKGNSLNAGYRYVDKKNGKVLLFKTDINSSRFFTYQILFLK